MNLPAKELVIDFDFISQESEEQYKGSFTILCKLTIGQKHLMELEKNRLLGDMVNPTDELMAMAIVLSSLRAKISDGPSWWKDSLGGAKIEDEDVLYALFKATGEAEQKWKDQLKKKISAPAITAQ